MFPSTRCGISPPVTFAFAWLLFLPHPLPGKPTSGVSSSPRDRLRRAKSRNGLRASLEPWAEVQVRHHRGVRQGERGDKHEVERKEWSWPLHATRHAEEQPYEQQERRRGTASRANRSPAGNECPAPSASAGPPSSDESLATSQVACQRQKYSPTANTGGPTQPDAPNELPQGSAQARTCPSGAPLSPSR